MYTIQILFTSIFTLRVYFICVLELLLIFSYFYCIFRIFPVPSEAVEIARVNGFDIQAHEFNAAKEQLRSPRRVKVGLFQNTLPLPTTTPVIEQRAALHKLAEKAISAAAIAGVNVFCFQEIWSNYISYNLCENFLLSLCGDKIHFETVNLVALIFLCLIFLAMPFAFCTRERLPWVEFAENAENGPTTRFLKEVT